AWPVFRHRRQTYGNGEQTRTVGHGRIKGAFNAPWRGIVNAEVATNRRSAQLCIYAVKCESARRQRQARRQFERKCTGTAGNLPRSKWLQSGFAPLDQSVALDTASRGQFSLARQSCRQALARHLNVKGEVAADRPLQAGFQLRRAI